MLGRISGYGDLHSESGGVLPLPKTLFLAVGADATHTTEQYIKYINQLNYLTVAVLPCLLSILM